MIERQLAKQLLRAFDTFSIITLTGPRQSGKTTLSRATFSELSYASLELPDVRRFARDDPRGFLQQYPTGAILDEVQYVPELTSYLQPLVDEPGYAGRWVLTGSENLALTASTSQSLAGRTAILELFPLELAELRSTGAVPDEWERLAWQGAYPAIYDRAAHPTRWLGAYSTTYLERDVRQLRNIGDLAVFQTFLGLAAGRASNQVNLSDLGASSGVTHPTVRSWLSVLEATYVTFRLLPWHSNLGKRLTKTPKLYFMDSGLLCYELGILEPEQLRRHPLRGAIFENWVISEIEKWETHRGRRPRLWFYRDQRRLEVDLLFERGGTLWLVEIKSARTIARDFFDNLRALHDMLVAAYPQRDVRCALVYGGDEASTRSGVEIVPWNQLDQWLGRTE